MTENPFYPVQLPIECSEISSILVDPSWRKSPSHWQKSSNTAYIGSNIYSKMKLTLTLWEICTVDTTSKSYANMTSKSAYIMTSTDMTSMSVYDVKVNQRDTIALLRRYVVSLCFKPPCGPLNLAINRFLYIHQVPKCLAVFPTPYRRLTASFRTNGSAVAEKNGNGQTNKHWEI